MGRTANYHTVHAKLAARKASKQRYAASDKGKQAIRMQNAQAYKRRTAAKHENEQAMSTRGVKLNIPDHLILLSRQPVKSTRLFREALRSADALDESELGVWDVRPPYQTLPVHMEDDAERSFTNRILEVMHGKRLREAKAEDEERVTRLRRGQYQEVVDELEDKVKTLLLTCQQDTESIATELPGSKRDKRMAQFHVEWAAKRLCLFNAELLALRSHGLQEFLQLYSTGKVGWQSVVIESA